MPILFCQKFIKKESETGKNCKSLIDISLKKGNLSLMSKNKKKIYKPRPISGFPEWLPEIRAVEQEWMDHIRRVFESYGYTNIETPVVEELDVLLAKGETDKEIYTLTRLQADEKDTSDARLGLHFDQTVPFARYTAQHFNSLDFPFKRYQMQKVWRGERPQLGRSREFYQCDIDVVNPDHLPIHFDSEMIEVMYEVLKGLNIGKFQIVVSNRKILLGLIDSLGIEDVYAVTRIVDKIDKINRDGVYKMLIENAKLTDEQSNTILDLVESTDLSTITAANDQMQQGLNELQFVMQQLTHLPDWAVKFDLSIIRGFDYYTGTVYEAKLTEIPEFKRSIGSGGRYDDLAGNYINRHLPGVGISIGLTCIFEVLHHYNYLKPSKKSPTDILVTLPSEELRENAQQTARDLRERGFNVETYHAPQKLQKQLSYAEKKGINYVWFVPQSDEQEHEVKNMATRQQVVADPKNWNDDLS